MSRLDEYGLRGLVGGTDSLDSGEHKERFERTQKAMADWRAQGGQGTLGDFYEWLGIPQGLKKPDELDLGDRSATADWH